MNFIEKFKSGQQGKNFGLSTNFKALDKAIDGIQRKSIYGVGAAPKVGKTTFVDQFFVIEPYLYTLANPNLELDVDWIYFSFEIDRIKKEYKFASYFFYKKFGISHFSYNGVEYELSSRYLLGRLRDDNQNLIPVSKTHKEMLKTIYYEYIIPLFGEYSVQGRLIKKGKIDFVEQKNNPTGLRNYLFKYAVENGEFLKEKFTVKDPSGTSIEKEKMIGYKPKNPDKYTIIVTDHIRKLNREKNYTMKENVDKWIEYQVELRNWCGFTFVDIAHLNRSFGDVDRIKFFAEHLYPTGDSFKDTGNLSEEADYVITLFNPQDEKYNIKKHFGLELENYPNYRSIHLVESRDTDCPIHMRANMFGNVSAFNPL